MKFHRNTIWLIPLLVIISFPIWSVPVGNFLTPRGSIDPASKNVQPDSQNFNMDKVKILHSQNGKKTAEIRAYSAQTGEEPNLFIMDFVNADLYDEEGNVTNIIANTGEYSTTTKILTLIGDVVINKTRDKQFLYTDRLIYDSEKRTVHCPGKTRLEGEDVTIDGGSLDYAIKTETYIIDKRVHCIISGFVKP